MSVSFGTVNILGQLKLFKYFVNQERGHLLSKLNHAFSPYFLKMCVSTKYPYTSVPVTWSRYVTAP